MLFQSLFRSKCGKMILGKTATAFAAKMLGKNICHSTDQTISLFKSMPAVKML